MHVDMPGVEMMGGQGRRTCSCIALHLVKLRPSRDRHDTKLRPIETERIRCILRQSSNLPTVARGSNDVQQRGHVAPPTLMLATLVSAHLHQQIGRTAKMTRWRGPESKRPRRMAFNGRKVIRVNASLSSVDPFTAPFFLCPRHGHFPSHTGVFRRSIKYVLALLVPGSDPFRPYRD